MALTHKCKRNKIFSHEKLAKGLTLDVWHTSVGHQQHESSPSYLSELLAAIYYHKMASFQMLLLGNTYIYTKYSIWAFFGKSHPI